MGGGAERSGVERSTPVVLVMVVGVGGERAESSTETNQSHHHVAQAQHCAKV